MEFAAARHGFSSLSEYVRHLHELMSAADEPPSSAKGLATQYPASLVQRFHRTALGTIYKGDSLGYLFHTAPAKSVDLIMTSPPFGLVRKKSYGNEDADYYCDWFRPFAEGFRRVLKDNASLVIDIGGAWIPGQPTRSLYHFKLLIMLCEEYGFHLCQEHYWWNPAKLPTPAEWVNIRRVRVKDAVNTVWWLSPTPWPKVNNRRILAPYSDSMKGLLKNGYTAKLRPSGHNISNKFQKDNGGSVPPNLLAIANTESNGRYQDYCRENNLDIHPARFPALLPEYFIRMLTNPGDLVVDPFGGSCVTGAVAETLRRRWVCCELSEEYLNGALARFADLPTPLQKDRSTAYQIHPPCALPIKEETVPLIENGGATRPASMTRTEEDEVDATDGVDALPMLTAALA
jgi:site-specific DNA-methyltransferase (cytosine-N4-specific)